MGNKKEMLVLSTEEFRDKVLEEIWKSGLEASFWAKNKDTGNVCGLKLIFGNGVEVYLGSMDQSLIFIEVRNNDGSIQSNIDGTEKKETSSC